MATQHPHAPMPRHTFDACKRGSTQGDLTPSLTHGLGVSSLLKRFSRSVLDEWSLSRLTSAVKPLSVMRLLSNARRQADPVVAQGALPDDAKERLRKSLQSCLRQTLLRLVSVLDLSEVGTSQLLAVPLAHLHTLVPGADVEGLACAEQWAMLAKRVGARTRNLDVTLSCLAWVQYEHNLRLRALSTLAHRSSESVVLRCTECGHPISSSWYFVHPRTGAAQVLPPTRCHFRNEEKTKSILDSFSALDFCEHGRQRSHCAACGGCLVCVHGKQRRDCRNLQLQFCQESAVSNRDDSI